MRLFTSIAAGMLAAVASAQSEPITSPFYLTFVEKNGTEYPATIGEASRGVKILSSWTEYKQLFTYDTETKFIYAQDHPEWGPSSGLGGGLPVIFTSDEGEQTPGSELEQVGANGATYIVKAGTADKGLNGWTSSPVTDDLFNNVFWNGVGNSKSNSALRIDLKEPSSRK